VTVLEVCTLRSTPRTVHLVKGPMLSVKEGVKTWCGRMGLAYEPTVSTWRHCRVCIRAKKEAAA